MVWPWSVWIFDLSGSSRALSFPDCLPQLPFSMAFLAPALLSIAKYLVDESCVPRALLFSLYIPLSCGAPIILYLLIEFNRLASCKPVF